MKRKHGKVNALASAVLAALLLAQPLFTAAAVEAAYLTPEAPEHMGPVLHIGTGTRGSLNADMQAASFTMPHSVLFDAQGNLVVVDTYSNMIRLVSESRVSTYAGRRLNRDRNGHRQGYYLDGGLEDALLNRPADAVFNSKNELLIADSANHVIRIVRDGSIYTFSGTAEGYADGGPETARFNRPMAIAIDGSDNIYVADTLNNCIRKIGPDGNVVTIAGMPGPGGCADGLADGALFLEPAGIAVSQDGNTVYVADTGNHRIRKIEGGRVSTIAGASNGEDEDGYLIGGFRDGEASQAMFNQPSGLAVVGDLILVADSGNHMVRIIGSDGSVATLCGNGEPGDEEYNLMGAFLNRPMGVCYYDGYLYIADTMNNRIKAVPFDGE